MRAFVSMRHFMASNTAIFQRFETLVRCLNFHPDAVKNTSGMSLELHPRCHWNFIPDVFFTASRMYFLLNLWRNEAICSRTWQICGRKYCFSVTHNVLYIKVLSENVADDSNFMKIFACACARKMGHVHGMRRGRKRPAITKKLKIKQQYLVVWRNIAIFAL